MDLRELIDDPEELFRVVIAAVLKSMNGNMPCRVTEDSKDGHRVSLQPTIKRAITDPKTGKLSYEDHPVIPDVPIQYPSGGGFTLTFPVMKGMEGIAVAISRNMDAWAQSGDTQQPIDDRMHHAADVMFIPGVRSDPRKIDGVSKESSQLRSDDGKHKVDIHQENGLTLSVEGGKHVTRLHPKDGISHESEVAVNIKAPKGTLTIPQLGIIGNLALSQAADGQGGNLKLEQDIVVRSITAETVNAPNGKVGS